jgi:hypothetical protein
MILFVKIIFKIEKLKFPLELEKGLQTAREILHDVYMNGTCAK